MMRNNPSSDLAALADPDTLHSVAGRLNVPHLEYFDEIDSTQNRVRLLAEQGGQEWTVVIADHQSDGRGQHGRTWLSVPGASLMFSVLLKPHSVGAMSLIPIRTGLAVVRALRTCLPNTEQSPAIQLKWPNDVIINDRKAGGILSEGQIRGEELTAIIGVGINIRQFNYPIASDAFLTPAFIEDEFHVSINRLDILESILREMRSVLANQSEILTSEELIEYAELDWLRGQRLLEPVEGVAMGINEHGHLAVQLQTGDTEFVVGGSVKVR